MRDLGEVVVVFLGWLVWVVWQILLTIWFPVLVVGVLCLIQRFRGSIWLQEWIFPLAILCAPLLPATGFNPFRVDLAYMNWLVYIVGLVAGSVLWLIHNSQMDIRRVRYRTQIQHTDF